MDKKLITIAVIAGIMIVALGILYALMQSSTLFISQPAQSGNGEVLNEEEQGGNNADNVIDANTGAKLTYTAAVNLYKDRRIQVSSTCQISPANSVFKVGAVVMLDNRSSTQKVVKLDGTAYALGAYDFKIITLTTSSALPHTISIDCGTGSNNGQIILQK